MPRSWFCAPMDLEELPQGVAYPHLATPVAVMRRYVEEFSRPGDTVLDPFSGYGSTLVAGEQLGRKAIGIEIDPERFDYATRAISPATRLIRGDAREIDSYDLPAIDLCLTGPPFFASKRLMRMDVAELADSYEGYLRNMAAICQKVTRLLRRGGHIVMLLCNVWAPAGFIAEGSPASLLPLAWDVGKAVSTVIPLVGEEIWCISRGSGHSPFAGSHGSFLIFRKEG